MNRYQLNPHRLSGVWALARKVIGKGPDFVTFICTLIWDAVTCTMLYTRVSTSVYIRRIYGLALPIYGLALPTPTKKLLELGKRSRRQFDQLHSAMALRINRCTRGIDPVRHCTAHCAKAMLAESGVLVHATCQGSCCGGF